MFANMASYDRSMIQKGLRGDGFFGYRSCTSAWDFSHFLYLTASNIRAHIRVFLDGYGDTAITLWLCREGQEIPMTRPLFYFRGDISTEAELQDLTENILRPYGELITPGHCLKVLHYNGRMSQALYEDIKLTDHDLLDKIRSSEPISPRDCRSEMFRNFWRELGFRLSAISPLGEEPSSEYAIFKEYKEAVEKYNMSHN